MNGKRGVVKDVLMVGGYLDSHRTLTAPPTWRYKVELDSGAGVFNVKIGNVQAERRGPGSGKKGKGST